MNPEIVEIPEKIIIGRHLTLSIDNHAVFPLWKQFRTEQSAHNLMGVDLYAIQTYAEWPPKSTITHWAGIEKIDGIQYPEDWKECSIGGKYACSIFQGTKSEFPLFVRELIVEWIPTSEYQLDMSRAHVQIMDQHYSVQDPHAQEYIMVPVENIP